MSSNTRRLEAAEAFARALRTGEGSAVRAASFWLATDAIFDANGTAIRGLAAIIDRLGAKWPLSPALARGIWSRPREVGEAVEVTADFAALGAAPRDYRLTFSFTAEDRIDRIEERYAFPSAADPLPAIPPHVASALDRALANGTPVALSYVDDEGYPTMSLRGSVQVYGDRELCAWLRNADGGLARAMRSGGPLGLLYRDSPTRTTLVIRGRGRIAEDEAARGRVFALAPEVEQTHDPARRGAALIVDVERIVGTSPQGPVLVQPPRRSPSVPT
ncbi:MAG: hypothetical protein JOZ27_06405 [Caulobacteraceae bacterium]|nr:hypothetical protein [Caulobacteraceae bacterium]